MVSGTEHAHAETARYGQAWARQWQQQRTNEMKDCRSPHEDGGERKTTIGRPPSVHWERESGWIFHRARAHKSEWIEIINGELEQQVLKTHKNYEASSNRRDKGGKNIFLSTIANQYRIVIFVEFHHLFILKTNTAKRTIMASTTFDCFSICYQ